MNTVQSLHEKAVLPLVRAQVGLKSCAAIAIELAVTKDNNGSTAHMVLDWWIEANKQMGDAIKAIETARNEDAKA